MKYVIHFCATYEKEHEGSFFAAPMMDMVKRMVSSDFLYGNCPPTNQCHIQVQSFSFNA